MPHMIKEVVLLAAEFHMDANALAKLKSDIESKKVREPECSSLMNAKVKLDVMHMHWMAEVYKKYDVTAYDIIDSSPQFGWNYLVIRTDEFMYPRNASALDRLKISLDDIYTRRTLPLSCLGYGKAGIVQKLQNYIHAGLLETQDPDRWLGPKHQTLSHAHPNNVFSGGRGGGGAGGSWSMYWMRASAQTL